MLKERGNPLLHFLDRYAGIPAIAVLGRLRRKRPLPLEIRTIGLLRTVAIGDTVLIGAVAADLRKAFPEALLIFFAGPSNYETAAMLEGVGRVVRVPTTDLFAGLKAVRSEVVDVMIDFGQWPRLEGLLTLFARAQFRVGFRTQGQYRHYGYDVAVEHSAKVHELENFRRLARAVGARCGSAPRLRVPALAAPMAKDYAVLHLWPGGRGRQLKEWPVERWLRLIGELAGQGVKVALTGAPGDREKNEALMVSVPAEARQAVTNAAGISLAETAALLAGARVVVSVNTGVMHVAAAVGAPLVALHGPTNSKRWGPVSESAVVIDSPLAGCGYLNLGWEYPRPAPECMKCIRYETVRDACLGLLRREPSGAGTREAIYERIGEYARGD